MMRAILMVLVLVGFCGGCCRKDEASCEKACVPADESQENLPVDQAPAEPVSLPQTVSAKSGMDKAQEYQLEMVQKRLPELAKQLSDASEACMKVEAEQRQSNPALGKLYSELINAKIAYRKAMDANTAYIEANAAKDDLFNEYKLLSQRRDALLKESGE